MGGRWLGVGMRVGGGELGEMVLQTRRGGVGGDGVWWG